MKHHGIESSSAGRWPAAMSRASAGLFMSAFLFVPTGTSASMHDGLQRPVTRGEQTNAGKVFQQRERRKAADALLELRHISGLTWDQLARLFNVSRRAVHFWASGQPLSAEKEEKLHQVLAAVEQIDRGTPEENRLTILTPDQDGQSPFDLLSGGFIREALTATGSAGKTVSRRLVQRTVESKPQWQPEELIDGLNDRAHAVEQLKPSTRSRVRREQG